MKTDTIAIIKIERCTDNPFWRWQIIYEDSVYSSGYAKSRRESIKWAKHSLKFDFFPQAGKSPVEWQIEDTKS